MLECPSCHNPSLAVGNPVSCSCGYKNTPESAAEDFVTKVLGGTYVPEEEGGIWPVYDCPDCDCESLVNLEAGDRSGESFFCLSCGEHWPQGTLVKCDQCGKHFNPHEREMVICEGCFDGKCS